jgi:hypothetical protein
MLALAFLAIGSIAVHVEEIEDLRQESARQLATAIEEAIRARTGLDVRLAEEGIPLCTSEDEPRCVEDVRKATGADAVVLLKLFGGPTTIRLVAERYDGSSRVAIRRAELSVRLSDPWSIGAEETAAGLYPEIDRRVPEAGGGASVRTIAPWAVLGGGVACAIGGGLVYATSARYDDHLDASRMPGSFDVGVTNTVHRSTAGLVLAGLGLAAIAAGFVWLVAE